MKPKVSIVIPYFNHGKFIEGTIKSVFDQDYDNIEVILVNDSSTDPESIEVFESLNDDRIQKYTVPNGGPCSAKNFGVSKAKSEIIGFLDSDNEFLPGYIDFAVESLSQEDVIWCFSDCVYFGDKTGVRNQVLKSKEEIFINSPIDNCLFIKKSCFEEIGGFDEYLNRLGLEDWELIVRLLINEKPFLHKPVPLFKYRVLNESRTNNEAKDNKRKIVKYVFDKHHDKLFEYYSEMYFELLMLKGSKEYKIGEKVRKIFKSS